MPADPKLVLDEDPVRLVISLPATQRRRLLAAFEELRLSWNESADFKEQDCAGRWLSVRVIQSFAITYWLDGPVDELRVVDIELISRK